MNYKLLLIPYVIVAICFLAVSVIVERRNHPDHSYGQGFAKILLLFLIGGVVYIGIELAFRGYSHWTMFLLGGFCFLQLGLINEVLPWKTPLELQALIGAILITINEFITGCIFNLGYGLHIWDYSNLPCNIMGQICIPFTIIWFFIAIIGIVVDDILRYCLWEEDVPRYYIATTKQEIRLGIRV